MPFFIFFADLLAKAAGTSILLPEHLSLSCCYGSIRSWSVGQFRRTGWLTSGTVLPRLLGWVVPIAIFCDIDTGHEEMFSVYADDKTIIAFLPTTHCTFVTLRTSLFLTRTINAAHPCQNDNALKHILKLNQCVST